MFNVAAVRTKAPAVPVALARFLSVQQLLHLLLKLHVQLQLQLLHPLINMCVKLNHMQGAMRGEKLVKANELLVKTLTANLLPPALMDSAEIRELLELIHL